MIDKIDLVFDKLFVESGHNPDMDKLEGWLAKKDIDKGEIQDITLYLYQEGYIYCELNGDRTSNYNDNARFLVNTRGKIFKETEKTFKDFFQREAAKISERAENEKKMIRWTKRLTLATLIAAALIVGWEMIKTFWIEHSCR